MRTLILIAVLALAPLALAADAPMKPYQAKAQAALAKYEKAVAAAEAARKAALAKAKADVAADLAVALKLATQAGDFDACKIIQAKADELAKTDVPAVEGEKTAATVLPGTRWSWGSWQNPTMAGPPGTIMFSADGTKTLRTTWGDGRWNVLANGTVEAWWGDMKHRHVITFSPDFKTLRGLRDDGQTSMGSRSDVSSAM